MTRQRYVKSPCNVKCVYFLFLNAATFRGISGQTHGVKGLLVIYAQGGVGDFQAIGGFQCHAIQNRSK